MYICKFGSNERIIKCIRNEKGVCTSEKDCVYKVKKGEKDEVQTK